MIANDDISALAWGAQWMVQKHPVDFLTGFSGDTGAEWCGHGDGLFADVSMACFGQHPMMADAFATLAVKTSNIKAIKKRIMSPIISFAKKERKLQKLLRFFIDAHKDYGIISPSF